jgi:ribosomal protein S18 acetylase RimI-like enzyme
MIVFKKVEAEAEAEILRLHRNECREFMTRNTAYITEDQQKEWFANAHKKFDLYLVYEVSHGAVIIDVGYGVIHKNERESLLTAGLLPNYRGQGIGQNVFQFLINQCDRKKPVKLEVLKSNTRAFIVYIKLGFTVVGENDKMYFMEYKYDSPI